MILDRIISGCGVESVKGSTAMDISAICNDSRKAVSGSLFIAVRGFASDGHSFIAKAVELGACAVVCEDMEMAMEQIAGKEVTLIKVQSSRHALAVIAANFYDNPSHKLTLVGITGTNGKTTTVTLLHRMFTAMGYSCGLLSTIANNVG